MRRTAFVRPGVHLAVLSLLLVPAGLGGTTPVRRAPSPARTVATASPDRAPVSRPGDVSRFTSSRESRRLQLDWSAPEDPAAIGVLVLANIQPISIRPVDGRRYRPFVVERRHLVLCVADRATTSCTTELPVGFLPVDGYTFYFEAFSFDRNYVYSDGVEAKSLPLASSGADWTYWTAATSMQPAGVSGPYVLGAGNDALVHRVSGATGRRDGWTPVAIPGAVTSRIMAGDIDPQGAGDETAYASAADGVLYRLGLDASATGPEASANVVVDAGCAAGTLAAGPVGVLDAFDLNPVDGDDAIVVPTHCGAADNRIVAYGLGLGAPAAMYDGGPDGLGVATATPRILYRDDAANLVYVGVHDDGGESLVALEIGAGPSLSLFASVAGIGNVDAIPVAFRRSAAQALLAVGTAGGTLYLHDAIERDGSALRSYGSVFVGDGAIVGVAASTRIAAPGGVENWLVWSTATAVHGVKVGVDGLLDPASRWDRTAAAPSGPVVLRNALAAGDTVAFYGTGNGKLVALDATTGATVREWTILTDVRVTEPTFDYGDGVDQALIVATDAGGVFRIPLVAPALATVAPKPAAISEEVEQEREARGRARR